MVNRLAWHLAYLIGPMDKASDRGRGWRQRISNFLWKRNIGVLSPTDNPVIDALQESDDYFQKINEYKQLGEYDKVQVMTTRVVGSDLHLVDLANFAIMHIDTSVHMCGSYNEETYACLEKKPLIVMCEQGKKHVPNWLWGMGTRHEMFFDSWDDVEDYIDYIDSSPEIDTLGKWKFINYRKVFNIGGN